MKNIPPEKRQHLDFQEWLNKKLEDPKFRREYEKLDAEFAPIYAILDARMKKGMTQAQIAKKMGTTQSSIARVEAGRSHPTIPYLQRLADALDMKLDVRFLPR